MAASKYHNKKTIVGDLTFSSKKEATRYLELKLMLKAGLISNLDLQTKFEVHPEYELNGKKIRPINYFADFTYYDKDGCFIVEDVKGKKTKEYILKKKMFEYKYPFTITEIY